MLTITTVVTVAASSGEHRLEGGIGREHRPLAPAAGVNALERSVSLRRWVRSGQNHDLSIIRGWHVGIIAVWAGEAVSSGTLVVIGKVMLEVSVLVLGDPEVLTVTHQIVINRVDVRNQRPSAAIGRHVAVDIVVIVSIPAAHREDTGGGGGVALQLLLAARDAARPVIASNLSERDRGITSNSILLVYLRVLDRVEEEADVGLSQAGRIERVVGCDLGRHHGG